MSQIIRVGIQRREWTLKQHQLAGLLGISQSTISRIELGEVKPDILTLLALEVVFGLSPRNLFPTWYQEVESTVMARAAELDRTLARGKPHMVRHKQRLLEDMAKRATANATDV